MLCAVFRVPLPATPAVVAGWGGAQSFQGSEMFFEYIKKNFSAVITVLRYRNGPREILQSGRESVNTALVMLDPHTKPKAPTRPQSANCGTATDTVVKLKANILIRTVMHQTVNVIKSK